MAALLQKYLTAARDAASARITHLQFTEDDTPHSVSQTVINPGGGSFVAKAAAITNVDANTFDATATVTSADYGGVTVRCFGIAEGTSNSDALSRDDDVLFRVPASNGSFTIAARVEQSDETGADEE